MTSKLVKCYNKHKKSTWIPQGVLVSIRRRDKLYKQLKLTNPDSSEYDMLLINLKTYNTIFYDYRPVSLLLTISKVLEKKIPFDIVILFTILQTSTQSFN